MLDRDAERDAILAAEGERRIRDYPRLQAKINRLRAEVERLRAQRNEALEIYDTALFDIAALKADAERLAGAGDKLRRIVSGGWVPSERDRQAKIAGWDEALRQHEEQK